MNCENDFYQLPSSWALAKLSDISLINPKTNLEGLADDLDVTFLPMKCIGELSGNIDRSIIKKLSEVKKGYTSFMDGDLLFAKITPCMENGKLAIAHDLRSDIGFGSTEFHIIRLHDSLVKKFFFFYISQEKFRKDAQRNMTGTAGQLRVPTTYLRKIIVPLPSASEQHRIVARIEELFSRLGRRSRGAAEAVGAQGGGGGQAHGGVAKDASGCRACGEVVGANKQ